MADFNIRSESVDVEQIMGEIRARIREKRGVDYTEDQIRELATVRLETFLDPKNLRSDLLDQFRRSRPALPADPAPVEPPYGFDDQTLFQSHRGGLRFMRKLLRPILKLFFNPNTLNQILHAQAQFNTDLLKREQRRKIEFEQSRGEWNALYYEVLHNLVLETTRTGIELKNTKMRLEALASRLDFSERRVRALEGVVQYRPEAVRRDRDRDRDRDRERDRDRDRARERPMPRETATGAAEPEVAAGPPSSSEGLPASPVGVAGPEGTAALAEGSRRRRRRRRGRRGPSQGPGEGAPSLAGEEPPAGDHAATAAPDDTFGKDDEDEAGSLPALDQPQGADAEPDDRRPLPPDPEPQ